VWQTLHAELEPAGLTIVTVALDTDIEAARPFDEAAAPTHPSLVDPALSLVDLFGITNVPFGVWIDEDGVIVRPAEVSFAPRPAPSPDAAKPAQDRPRMPRNLSPEHQKVIEGMTRATRDPSRYAAAVRDWVSNGSSSRFVLSPQEVVARSRPRPPEAAMAAAEYELGQHLHRAGYKIDAVAHFQEAHRLDPKNWSYPRNAYAIVDRDEMGDPYGTNLLDEVGRVGPETFYPELEMEA
jgi:hypothetical protein